MDLNRPESYILIPPQNPAINRTQNSSKKRDSIRLVQISVSVTRINLVPQASDSANRCRKKNEGMPRQGCPNCIVTVVQLHTQYVHHCEGRKAKPLVSQVGCKELPTSCCNHGFVWSSQEWSLLSWQQSMLVGWSWSILEGNQSGWVAGGQPSLLGFQQPRMDSKWESCWHKLRSATQTALWWFKVEIGCPSKVQVLLFLSISISEISGQPCQKRQVWGPATSCWNFLQEIYEVQVVLQF